MDWQKFSDKYPDFKKNRIICVKELYPKDTSVRFHTAHVMKGFIFFNNFAYTNPSQLKDFRWLDEQSNLEAQKTSSTLQKDLIRVKKIATKNFEAVLLRKEQAKQFNNLVRKLLKEKRITKAEVSEFIKRKPISI